MRVRDNGGVERIRLNGASGRLTVFDTASGDEALRLDGNNADLRLGRVGMDGDVFVTRALARTATPRAEAELRELARTDPSDRVRSPNGWRDRIDTPRPADICGAALT